MIAESLGYLIESLYAIAEKYREPIIFSTHPRTRKPLDAHPVNLDPLVEVLKPMVFSAYNMLRLIAHLTLSDSGTIIEESFILIFAATNIRDTHERPREWRRRRR